MPKGQRPTTGILTRAQSHEDKMRVLRAMLAERILVRKGRLERGLARASEKTQLLAGAGTGRSGLADLIFFNKGFTIGPEIRRSTNVEDRR